MYNIFQVILSQLLIILLVFVYNFLFSDHPLPSAFKCE